MKIKRILSAAFLAGFSLLSAPLAVADETPGVEVRVAQSQFPEFPVGGDNRGATLGHIRWLAARSDIRWEHNELRWEENQRRWEENQRGWERNQAQLEQIRAEMATRTNTMIAFMGVIILALAGVIAVLIPRRERAARDENHAGRGLNPRPE